MVAGSLVGGVPTSVGSHRPWCSQLRTSGRNCEKGTDSRRAGSSPANGRGAGGTVAAPPPDPRPSLSRYRFVTEFRTSASPASVFEVMLHPDAWIHAWGDALRVERLTDGDEHGTGAAYRAAVRAPAGYTIGAQVTIVEARRPSHLVAALAGDLDGRGTWTFRDDGAGGTDAHLDMTATTTRRWMNAAARVARPLFEWSHGQVMRHAAQAAADHLDAELLDFRSDPVR